MIYNVSDAGIKEAKHIYQISKGRKNARGLEPGENTPWQAIASEFALSETIGLPRVDQWQGADVGNRLSVKTIINPELNLIVPPSHVKRDLVYVLMGLISNDPVTFTCYGYATADEVIWSPKIDPNRRNSPIHLILKESLHSAPETVEDWLLLDKHGGF